MKKDYKKEKKIERAIRLVWDSLESHLKYTQIKTSEGANFHKECVRDYSELIKILSELL